MIATDLAAGLDPVVLARRVGLDPDPWQADVLRSAAPRQLLNASRQSGKSTTVALLNVHEAAVPARQPVPDALADAAPERASCSARRSVSTATWGARCRPRARRRSR